MPGMGRIILEASESECNPILLFHIGIVTAVATNIWHICGYSGMAMQGLREAGRGGTPKMKSKWVGKGE